MARALPVAGILLLNLAAAALSLPRADAAAGAPTLVVAPPWVDPAEAAREAGGRLLTPLVAPLAVLASFPDPGFPARLAAQGAWSFDGGAAAWFCGVSR